jgi:hypothetical protein
MYEYILFLGQNRLSGIHPPHLNIVVMGKSVLFDAILTNITSLRTTYDVTSGDDSTATVLKMSSK